MARADLSEKDIENLRNKLIKVLRTEVLESPGPHESEPAFTARILQPPVERLLKRVGVDGLIQTGEGSHRVNPSRLLGMWFYPDLGIAYHGEPLIAIEVKYLRRHNRQSALATALGQTIVYGLTYPEVALLLIDLEPEHASTELEADVSRIESQTGAAVIFRQTLRNELLQDRRES